MKSADPLPPAPADAAEFTPTKQRFAIEAATGYLMLGMTKAALRELAPFRDTRLPPVLRLRGEALREQERHTEALREYDDLLHLRPGDLSAVIGKAWCLKRLDRLSDAIDTLRSGAAAHPSEALIPYNLACYFALQRDKARCLAHLGRALRMDASYVELIEAEPDFEGVRGDADFQELVEAVARVA